MPPSQTASPPTPRAKGSKLNLWKVTLEVGRLFRDHAPVLLPASVIAAGVPAVVELTIAHELPFPWDTAINIVLDTVLTTIVAGIAEILVARSHEGQPWPSPGALWRRLRPVLWPILVASLIYSFGVILGLLLLIVPGFIVMARWTLVAPVIVSEGRGIRAALGRSNELVKGNTMRVIVVLFATSIAAALAAQGLLAVLRLLGYESAEADIGPPLGEALDLPLEAIAAPVMYAALREMREVTPSGEHDEPAEKAAREEQRPEPRPREARTGRRSDDG